MHAPSECFRPLQLFPLSMDDLPALSRALAKEPCTRSTGLPRPSSPERAEGWLREVLREQEESSGLVFGIWVAGAGLVGTIRLGGLCWRRRVAQLSYWIAPAHRRLGHGSRAAAEALALAFDRLGLRSLRSFAYRANAPSRRLLRSLGFEERGPLPSRGSAGSAILTYERRA